MGHITEKKRKKRETVESEDTIEESIELASEDNDSTNENAEDITDSPQENEDTTSNQCKLFSSFMDVFRIDVPKS